MNGKTLFPIVINSNLGRDYVLSSILDHYDDVKTIFLLTSEEDREFYYDGI